MTQNADYVGQSRLPHHVIATLILPCGEWAMRVDEARNVVTIKAKGPVDPRVARRLLIVDGGEVPSTTLPHIGRSEP
jgi:hypothetical protein